MSDEEKFPNVIITPFSNRHEDPAVRGKLIDIQFARPPFNGTELKPDHHQWLKERVVPFLNANKNPDTVLELAGHASRKGLARKFDNVGLSEKRIQAVLKVIRDAGATGFVVRTEARGSKDDPFNDDIEHDDKHQRAVTVSIFTRPLLPKTVPPPRDKFARPNSQFFLTHKSTVQIGKLVGPVFLVISISESRKDPGRLFVYSGLGVSIDANLILKVLEALKNPLRVVDAIVETIDAEPVPFRSFFPRKIKNFDGTAGQFAAGALGAFSALHLASCTAVRIAARKINLTLLAQSQGVLVMAPQ
jgi:hypothetical protein